MSESAVQKELLRECRLQNHYLRKLNRRFNGIFYLVLLLLAIFAGYIVFAVRTLGHSELFS